MSPKVRVCPKCHAGILEEMGERYWRCDWSGCTFEKDATGEPIVEDVAAGS